MKYVVKGSKGYATGYCVKPSCDGYDPGCNCKCIKFVYADRDKDK